MVKTGAPAARTGSPQGEDEEKRREAKTETPTAKTSSSQGEDEEKLREAKTEAPTAKTRAPTANSKTGREGVRE